MCMPIILLLRFIHHCYYYNIYYTSIHKRTTMFAIKLKIIIKNNKTIGSRSSKIKILLRLILLKMRWWQYQTICMHFLYKLNKIYYFVARYIVIQEWWLAIFSCQKKSHILNLLYIIVVLVIIICFKTTYCCLLLLKVLL